MTISHFALVGPTASGKSALALAIARELDDIEIISMDSMQVYRGMDIGTAKPIAADLAEIPHHLVDVIDPDEQWSVQRFQTMARAAVVDVEARGKRALLVGGTGLYVQAVIDDLRFPGEDLQLRAELEAQTAQPGGVAAAYSELVAADPVAAAKIDPHNVRRIVRALEVFRLTGEPFSSFGPGMQSFGPTAFPVRIAGVWIPRAVLATRITERFGAMRDAGLVKEVEGLRARGDISRTARQAIGYQEIMAHLEGGEPSLDAALETAVRRTRSFARRQRMWFRRDPRITWFGAAEVGNGEKSGRILPALLASWS